VVIGKPGLIAYSKNISSLAESLTLFITNDILNEMCHHTNAEGSFQIPKMWKDISSVELFAFLGLFIVSGFLRTRNQQQSCGQQRLPMPDQFFVEQWQEIGSFKFFMSFVSMTKL